MNRNNILGWTITCLMATALAGCMTDKSRRLQPPEANAGPNQAPDDFPGGTVSITLDGSGSMDKGGSIVEYRWDRGTTAMTADGGTDFVGPDPADTETTTVDLGEGVWHFMLWVTDDEGLMASDSVTITLAAKTCDLDACPELLLGDRCCTSADTGAEVGDWLGRSPDQCGSDLGGVIASLAGTCLQTDQPGEPSAECPDIMVVALEPGCCTDEGRCGSMNTTTPLGCHYPQTGPTDATCTPP